MVCRQQLVATVTQAEHAALVERGKADRREVAAMTKERQARATSRRDLAEWNTHEIVREACMLPASYPQALVRDCAEMRTKRAEAASREAEANERAKSLRKAPRLPRHLARTLACNLACNLAQVGAGARARREGERAGPGGRRGGGGAGE